MPACCIRSSSSSTSVTLSSRAPPTVKPSFAWNARARRLRSATQRQSGRSPSPSHEGTGESLKGFMAAFEAHTAKNMDSVAASYSPVDVPISTWRPTPGPYTSVAMATASPSPLCAIAPLQSRRSEARTTMPRTTMAALPNEKRASRIPNPISTSPARIAGASAGASRIRPRDGGCMANETGRHPKVTARPSPSRRSLRDLPRDRSIGSALSAQAEALDQ